MPSKAAHVAAAKRNQATLDYLLAGGDAHRPWVATVAFYKALHVIETVFVADQQSPLPHTDFAQYMSRADVEQRLLGHYLAQIEASAARLLGEADLFA